MTSVPTFLCAAPVTDRFRKFVQPMNFIQLVKEPVEVASWPINDGTPDELGNIVAETQNMGCRGGKGKELSKSASRDSLIMGAVKPILKK